MRKCTGIRAAILAAVYVAAFSAASAAQEDTAGSTDVSHGGIGLGVILGEPTGLSGKMWTTRSTAFDIGVAWSFSGNGHFHLHADYLFHRFDLFQVEKGSLPLYFGIGGRMLIRDEADDKVGVRFPVGLEYYFDGFPMAIFGELVPILDLAPDTDFEINGGIGFRYYF